MSVMNRTNRNFNFSPDAASNASTAPGRSRVATASVAGDLGGSDAPSTTSAAYRDAVTSVTVYFLLLLRDLLTFLTRGGISAMMFAMDQMLRVLLLLAEMIFGHTGSSVLGYPCRVIMWLYQLLLWVAYTMVELLFYLPWQVLLVYIAVLCGLLLWMPSPLLDLFAGVFKTLHSFIGVYKLFYRLLGGSDPVIADAKH